MITAEQKKLRCVPEIPAVGWHPDISSETYHAWPAASSTRLNRMRGSSPAHVRYEIEHPPEASPAMAFGAALHDLVLSPGQFDKRYAVAPDVDRRTKDGKEKWAAFCEECKLLRHISEADFQLCQEIRSALLSHEQARHVLSAFGDHEFSGFWIDQETGCPCKLRPDAMHRIKGVELMSDLKTTEDASPEGFARSVINFGYHRQAAFYLDGAAALGKFPEAFVIVAVEKSPPFAVAVYRIPDELLELGRSQNRPLIELWAGCSKSGEWPGYSEKIMTLTAPPWAFKQD